MSTRPKTRTDAGRTLTIRLPEHVLDRLAVEANVRVLSRTKLAELLIVRGLDSLPPLNTILTTALEADQ